MIVDAISDPLIGRWSDRFSHKLGRRHPFLYQCIAYPYSLFPDLGCTWVDQTGLFFHMLIVTIFTSIVGLAFDTAHSANARTMTSAPNTTTGIASAWFSGCLVSVLMYGWWLADTASMSMARASRAEVVAAGGTTAVVIFLGVCRFFHKKGIPELNRPKPTDFPMIAQTDEKNLVERNLLAIFVCGLLAL